jgi:Rad52/22 family double-strand break repair protein
MGFSTRQLRALRRDVDHRKIRTREINGRELSYIEGWHSIAEANRIFGFDGWTRETLESRCVLSREVRGTFHAIYASKVRITVFANGRTVIREGHGTGEGQGSSAAESHDTAIKGAETDATKRALATFGKPFGLSLYLSDHCRPPNGNVKRPLFSARQATINAPLSPTPVPENSNALAQSTSANPKERDAPVCGPDLILGSQAPQSTLPLAYPRRIRDRDHLKFVTNHACLQCGRWPSDAHHITFAQPRALGMKVSDEFTVPLCRLHHREVHRARDEKSWWDDLKIDPIAVANRLWQESHEKLSSPRVIRTGQKAAQGQPTKAAVRSDNMGEASPSVMSSNQNGHDRAKADEV